MHPRDPSPTSAERDALARGDERAFEQLFEEYADRLCRYVNVYLRSWEDAENLVQDVFLQLWKTRDRFRDVENVQAYVYAFARNRARDYLKHQAVKSKTAEQYPPISWLPPEGEQRVADAEAAAAIRQAIDLLPPRQRAVMELRWRRQLTYEEIANELGLDPKTVATHMTRAIQHLRRLLSRFA